MEVEIFAATPEDREDFRTLWSEYLLEHEKLGSDIMATPRSLGFFMQLFDSYVSGSLLGIALLARKGGEPVGALIWGALPPAPFDRVDEGVVCGWGAYTVPSYRRQGISRALRRRAIMDLYEGGATTVIGSALLTNTPGVESSRNVGFEPISFNGVVDLAKEVRNMKAAEMFGEQPITDGFYWEGLCPLCGKE